MAGLGLAAEIEVFAMQANPKPSEGETPAAPAAAPAAQGVAVQADLERDAHASPARALQARLLRELTRARKPWLWHSTGLVLVLLLSLCAAGVILNASL